jgi:predicted CopG family antitoxin
MLSTLTTIQIQKETREELREFGKKGETYEDVIKKLMEIARRVEFFEDIDRILETEEFRSLDEI